MNKPIYTFLTLIFASLLIFPLYGMETTSNSLDVPAKRSFIAKTITFTQNLAYKTPFFAGWRSNSTQKEAAQEIIQNLLFEKAQLKTKLYSPNIDQEEKTTISQQITEINKQIHDQKVITGEKWSRKRTIIWKALCTFSGIALTSIGLIIYKDTHQYIQSLISLSRQDQLNLQEQLTQEQLTAQRNDKNQLRTITTLQQRLNNQKNLIAEIQKNSKSYIENLESHIENIKKQAEEDLQKQKEINKSLKKSSQKAQQDLREKLKQSP